MLRLLVLSVGLEKLNHKRGHPLDRFPLPRRFQIGDRIIL